MTRSLLNADANVPYVFLHLASPHIKVQLLLRGKRLNLAFGYQILIPLFWKLLAHAEWTLFFGAANSKVLCMISI